MHPIPKQRSLLPIPPTRLTKARDFCSLVDEALTNERAWRRARWLVAGDKRYEVVTNPPTIKNVSQICHRCTSEFSISAAPEREADRWSSALSTL